MTDVLGDCNHVPYDVPNYPDFGVLMGLAFKEVKSSTAKCFSIKNDTALFSSGEPYFPICYESVCSKNGTKDVITVTVGSGTYKCTENLQAIDLVGFNDSSLICP